MQMLGKFLESPLFKKRSGSTNDLRKAHSHMNTLLQSKALFLVCYVECSLLSETYEYSEKLFAGFILQLVAQ